MNSFKLRKRASFPKKIANYGIGVAEVLKGFQVTEDELLKAVDEKELRYKEVTYGGKQRLKGLIFDLNQIESKYKKAVLPEPTVSKLEGVVSAADLLKTIGVGTVELNVPAESTEEVTDNV